MFFKHFASTNQLPGFFISWTSVENGLMISSWFKNKVRFGFWYQFSMQLSYFRGNGNKKKHDIGINLSILKFMKILINTFEVTPLFLKSSTLHKTSSKREVSMQLCQTCYLTCICSCIKFDCPQVRGSWVIWTQQSSTSHDKSMTLFWICLF